ncbi:MAG: 50S ribosomal protein L21 [Patescibacteria group bacterium]
MTIAVIKTGGKQYKVSEGQTIKIEKITGLENTGVVFDQVLLIASDEGKDVKIGAPILEGSTVSGEVVADGHDRTILVGKYKNKTRYHKTHGHRQQFMKVKIDKIN